MTVMKPVFNIKKRVNTFYIICTILAAIVIILLAACRDIDNDKNDNDDVLGHTDNSIFEAYIYQSHNIFSLQLPYPVSGVLVNEENIVYWHVDSSHDIVVTTVAVDGHIVQRAIIPAKGEFVDVGGLQITDDGNIALIKVEHYESNNTAITYGVYDWNGTEIISVEISNTVTRGYEFVRVKQAVFTDDEKIAIVLDDAGPFNNLFLLNGEGNVIGQLQINSALNIGRLRDGRVVALQRERFVEGAGMSLREIDFEAGDWGNSTPLTILNVNRIFAAGAGQSFDLIASDGRFLYGYTLETHTQTPIIDWMEAVVIPTFDDHICILPDDSIVLIQTGVEHLDEENEWHTDFFVLSRASRDEIPQKTVLTLASSFIYEGIQREIIAFNNENQDYRIELLQYSLNDIDRLRIEMITTGRGPDIFLEHPVFPIGDEFYADLYSFIDKDPVINRTDFFQSVLNIMEDGDGKLPLISQHYYLSTQFTMRETAAQIGPLTFTNILRRLNEPDAPRLSGNLITRDYFVIQIINSSGDTFIDMTNNEAHLDSEEFISLLEIAYRLPEYQDDFSGVSLQEEVEMVKNGEQLFFPVYLHMPGNIRNYRALFGDIVAVGMLTNAGGQHGITMMWERFAINAGSPHQDAAWSFVRRFFLPETEVPPYGVPLRIDKYEELIAELMIPDIADGEEVPQQVLFYEHQLEIYAMTEEEAAMLREIIDSVSFASRQDDIISAIFGEVIPPFLNGLRSAQETARILQNRVQRYLDERS
jgi:ABC-type glycerol-3-phosphate transport system substrate-binding protein